MGTRLLALIIFMLDLQFSTSDANLVELARYGSALVARY